MNTIEKTPTVPPYTIKHLIISGGGVYGFSFYGMLKELNLNKVWNISNIKTIHATSAGTVIATIIALNYDWETMDKYIYNKNIFEPIKINISWKTTNKKLFSKLSGFSGNCCLLLLNLLLSISNN